ncbi:MAG: hypothetical protein PVH61_19715 [Candidatus Aminicenantes bacterium]|jgi:hypothetical protein
MEIIDEKILKYLGELSRVNIDFIEFIKKNPQALKRSSYNDLMNFPLAINKLQPWPTFVSRQVRTQLQGAGTAVFQLVKQVPQRLFNNDPQKIGAYFGIPAEYIQLQLESIKSGHLENLLARGDFIFSATGLKCIEYNVTGAMGGLELPLMESLYLKNPIMAKFFQENRLKNYNNNQYVILLRHLLAAAGKKFPNENHREINIAFTLPEYKRTGFLLEVEEYLNRVYHQVRGDHDNPTEGTVIICDFPHLTTEKNAIFFNGKRIHILVEMYHGDVPRTIFFTSLLGNVMLYNGPVTQLLSNKLTQALLSENENTGVFSQQESQWIKAYIPWTRRIVPGKVTVATGTLHLEDFLYTRREQLVIKPVRELGGKDVCVGRFTPAGQWEEVVKRALGDETNNWIVQEYIEPSTHLYQYGNQGCAEHQVIWGIFIFGTTYGGGFLRLLPYENTNGVINTRQGATKTVIFEVDR